MESTGKAGRMREITSLLRSLSFSPQSFPVFPMLPVVEKVSILKCLCSGLGDCVVLFTRSAAHPDGSNYHSILLQWNAAGKDHHPAIIGSMNSEELAARLAVRRQIFRRDIESARGPCFLDRNIDAADPGSVHPNVSHQISTGIGHRDIHRLADLSGLLFRCGDNSTRIIKSHL